MREVRWQMAPALFDANPQLVERMRANGIPVDRFDHRERDYRESAAAHDAALSEAFGRRASARPFMCVAFEDTKQGVQAARAAGMCVIGVARNSIEIVHRRAGHLSRRPGRRHHPRHLRRHLPVHLPSARLRVPGGVGGDQRAEHHRRRHEPRLLCRVGGGVRPDRGARRKPRDGHLPGPPGQPLALRRGELGAGPPISPHSAPHRGPRVFTY